MNKRRYFSVLIFFITNNISLIIHMFGHQAFEWWAFVCSSIFESSSKCLALVQFTLQQTVLRERD